MKILLTLDYELFLGEQTGTVERCLVQPMRNLLKQIEGMDVHFTIFVDAAYLYRLNELSGKYPALAADYETLTAELQALAKSGHDIQLHIHPQWYYSSFDGKNWILDQKHYKLVDVPTNQMAEWFRESKDLLDGIVGKKTHAFRAGGFSAQPFVNIKPLFETNGITVDSSACPGTKYDSNHQRYDYTSCPNKAMYHFEDDLDIIAGNGRFTEIPLTMYPVSPTFYWKLVLNRLLKSAKHVTIGDGYTVKTTTDSIVERLTKKSLSLTTIDGMKIRYLYNSLCYSKRQGRDIICVIGHPKLATPYSVSEFGNFCRKALKEGHEFIVVSDLIEK